MEERTVSGERMEERMTLGEQIKEARERKNYSQEELAEMCGVSRQAVSKWENNNSVPQGTNRDILKETLGIEIEFPREEKAALKKRLFVWGGWITAAVLLLGVICIGIYIVSAPEVIEKTDTQPRVTSVCFYDSRQKEVRDEALWYNAAHIESILVQWEGAAPVSISIHYIPGGTNMVEYTELLATKEILDTGTAALLSADALKDKKIMGHVTFMLDYGSFTVYSDQYNIFYDPEG